MSKKQTSVREKVKPSQADIATLKSAIQKLGTFDKFLTELKAIEFQDGEMVVINHNEYTHWNDVHSYLQAVQWYEFEARMKESPEEAAAFKEMVKSHRPEFIIKRMPKV